MEMKRRGKGGRNALGTARGPVRPGLGPELPLTQGLLVSYNLLVPYDKQGALTKMTVTAPPLTRRTVP